MAKSTPAQTEVSATPQCLLLLTLDADNEAYLNTGTGLISHALTERVYPKSSPLSEASLN